MVSNPRPEEVEAACAPNPDLDPGETVVPNVDFTAQCEK